MALRARYLVDKSALARFPLPSVGARLRPLLEDGLVATCAIVDLEVLYSARSLTDYEQVLEERRSLDAAPITPKVMATAIELQHALRRAVANTGCRSPTSSSPRQRSMLASSFSTSTATSHASRTSAARRTSGSCPKALCDGSQGATRK